VVRRYNTSLTHCCRKTLPGTRLTNRLVDLQSPHARLFSESERDLDAAMRWDHGKRCAQSSGLEESHTSRAQKSRKRPRNIPEPLIASHPPNRSFVISNHEEVWDFYEQCFKNCQQTACKLIAKAWIKAVEPKKQSTYPYTKADEKAPEWWPKPWGAAENQRVRHKEPDHLYKRGLFIMKQSGRDGFGD
jgi:hypothetical protein